MIEFLSHEMQRAKLEMWLDVACLSLVTERLSD